MRHEVLSYDENKAFKLLKQVSVLGSIKSHFELGIIYLKQNDLENGIHPLRLAAVGGHKEVRHIPGELEIDMGSKNLAKKHFVLSTGAG